MSAVSEVPLIVFRNDDPWFFPFQWKLKDGTPRNIVFVTVEGRVGWSGGSIPLTVSNGGIVISNAQQGAWNVLVAASLYANVPDGQKSHLTLWMTDEAGVVLTRVKRPIRVEER